MPPQLARADLAKPSFPSKRSGSGSSGDAGGLVPLAALVSSQADLSGTAVHGLRLQYLSSQLPWGHVGF